MSGAKRLSLEFLVPLAFVVSAIVFGVAVTSSLARPSIITWERDYGKAIKRAQAENKLIVADMFTDWCALCKQMDAETFADPKVIENIGNQFVWLKLNTETEEDGKRLQEEFSILTYPTILVLDDQGEEVDRIDRFLAASPFRERARSFGNSPDS